MKTLYKNIYILISLFIFTILIIPFITTLPLRDGNVDFVQSYYFFQGGYDTFFQHFSSAHPPLKVLALSSLYHILGIHSEIIILLGYISGIGGIISAFIIGKNISNLKTGGFFAIFLSVNPLFLSTSIFALTDYLLTNLILICIALLLEKKLFLYTLALIAIVLIKETGLLLLIILFILDLIYSKKKNLTTLPYLASSAAYLYWQYFLHSLGKGAWSDYIFASTADKGTFYTVVFNILTFQFINTYAYQQLLQLLFLNSNWIMIGLSICFTILFFTHKNNRAHFIQMLLVKNQKSKSIAAIISFCFLYCISVLTLQTYTIPRYALPLIPFIILWFLVVVQKIRNKTLEKIFITFVFCVSAVSLFISLDPFASNLWGRKDFLGQKVYALDKTISGNDGITYNLQFIKGANLRSKIIKNYAATNTKVPWRLCKNMFPDPDNDRITMQALGIQKTASCLNSHAVSW